MRFIDFPAIVREAWAHFAPDTSLNSVTDISVRVSTNHVYQIVLESGGQVFAKLSYFGKYEYFKEDHTLINVLANTLPPPYTQFLSRSFTKDGQVFVLPIPG